MITPMNVNDASNALSEPSKPVEHVDDSMDVDEVSRRDVREVIFGLRASSVFVEVPAATTSPYKAVTVPGHPHLVAGLDLPEDFEEEEAEMSSDEDDDEEVDEIEEGRSTGVSTAVLLDKSLDETDDADDEDYVPTE
ncbi:hypothetical protein ACEPAG_6587 [Sanghuangporus baumii]